MARGAYITEFEREIIRIGHARGLTGGQIAKYLRRERTGIYRIIKEMEDDGTLANVPFDFICDDVEAAIRARDS